MSWQQPAGRRRPGGRAPGRSHQPRGGSGGKPAGASSGKSDHSGGTSPTPPATLEISRCFRLPKSDRNAPVFNGASGTQRARSRLRRAADPLGANYLQRGHWRSLTRVWPLASVGLRPAALVCSLPPSRPLLHRSSIASPSLLHTKRFSCSCTSVCVCVCSLDTFGLEARRSGVPREPTPRRGRSPPSPICVVRAESLRYQPRPTEYSGSAFNVTGTKEEP